MIYFRSIALALAIGLAPTSSIITNRACADDATPVSHPLPLHATASESAAELQETRAALAASLRSLDANFASEEAALEFVKAAWTRGHDAGSMGEDGKEAARQLVAMWAAEDVRRTREAALAAPLATLEAARDLRPGQLAALRLEKDEFGRRLEAIRGHMVKHAMLVIEEGQARINLDVQGREVTDEERRALHRKFHDQRDGNREALGTARFGGMFALLKPGALSTELPALGEEPSGTRLEVLYWRFEGRVAQLKEAAARRKELEETLRALHQRLSPVGPGDFNPEPGDPKLKVLAALEELRALDRRQAHLALAVAQLRVDLWSEVESSVGHPGGEGMAEWAAARRGLLETGRDRMLIFASQGREPGQPRQNLDDAAQTALKEEAGARVRAAILRVKRALVDLGESDATLDGIARRAETGGALDAALQGYAADGVSDVFGTTAVAIGDAYARAAFARPAQLETFLDKPFGDDVKKALKDVDPSQRFWSTQELSRTFADAGVKASAAEVSTVAARLQAERLLALLGEAVE